jgi:pimeloyl-ACP methyl ester carboxylesterase
VKRRSSILFALGVAACQPSAEEPATEDATLQLLPCRVRGLGQLAECGTLDVPENPAAPDGRTIGLHVVRLSARNSEDRVPDPLFLLAGGPGQAATEAYPPVVPALGRILRTRDIVLVDQRGTGQSSPLDCDSPEGLEANLREDALVETARKCREELDADLTQYSTRRAAADLDAVREALGYERINLFGGSYGTRLALEYLRRHGDHARSAIIDGVAPRAMKLPLHMAADGQRALEKIFAACGRDEACHAAFGDLGKRFEGLLASFPREIHVRDPRTAERVEVTLTRPVFTSALRGLLYSPELTSLLPLTIERSAEGDFQSFVAQASVLGESASEMMSLGLFLSVVCGEDVARITDAEIDEETKGTFLGRTMLDELRAACEGWPHPDLEDDFADPVVSDVPVLALSGELDPVTPPRWADAAVEHLANSRHLVVPGAAHGTVMRGCTAKLMRRFLDAPAGLDDLDAGCLENATVDAPPFFIDFAGPPH